MIRGFVDFLATIYLSRDVVVALAKRQLAARYIGTIAGPIWTVAQPLSTVAIFWVVFSLGFHAQGPNHTPFLLYFLPGYVSWLLFSEIVLTSTGVIVANAYLVKKTVFPVQVLPMVQIVSATVPHLVTLVATLLFVLFYRGALPLALPAVVYFYAATVVLALGISWIASSLNVFYRDIGQIVSVGMNLWFWATPIAWPANILPTRFDWLLHLNPMYFVVEGYRASLTGAQTGSVGAVTMLLFWLMTGVILIAGAQIFRRLKPEFPEML